MNELIDSGDPRAKVVGKRRPLPDNLDDRLVRFDHLQKNFARMWGKLPFKRGVYRFNSFEEFDQWKSHQMMRNSPARRKSEISSPSAGN